MVTILPKENDWSDVGNSIGTGLAKGYTNRSDEMALQKSIGSLPPDASPRQILDAITNTRTYSPESKQRVFKNYIGAKEVEETVRKAKASEAIAQEKNRIAAAKKGTEAERELTKQSYLEAGYPEYEADLLVNPDVTAATKQSISKQHADLVARKIRQPLNSQAANPAEQESIETQQKEQVPLEQDGVVGPENAAIEEAKIEANVPEKEEEWPEIPPPPETTFAEKEKWRASNQKENNKLLKETHDKNNAHTKAVIRLNRASTLNDTHKVAEGLGRIAIDPKTGDPYPEASLLGAVNKETQAFVKTIADFLIDAKTYFGARVTNFDIGAFKARLPSLLNTEEGRRIIIQQMKLMEDLELVHGKEMDEALKHYGRNASYSDIQKVVDERTSKKEQVIIDKMNNVDKASELMEVMLINPKYKDTTLYQNPETGKFKAVRPGDKKEFEDKGWIKW